jgi:hypothetical protein
LIKKGLKAIEFLQDVRQMLLLLLEASIELLHLCERLIPLLHEQTQAGFGITLPARGVSLAGAKAAGLQPGAHRPGPMSTGRCRHGQLNGVQPLQPDPKPIEGSQGGTPSCRCRVRPVVGPWGRFCPTLASMSASVLPRRCSAPSWRRLGA